MWEACNEDLSVSMLNSFRHTFGKRLHCGAKWIGNDPALLFLLFREHMDTKNDRETTYEDDIPTLNALVGAIERQSFREGISSERGGWIREKQEFVQAQNDARWDSEGLDGMWRKLRKLPNNIYSDIEDLTKTGLETEQSLVSFALSLVEGGDVPDEVMDNVCANWNSSVMFGNAINWSGRTKETHFNHQQFHMSNLNMARNDVSVIRRLGIQYHILIETIADTDKLGLSFKNKWHELGMMRKLDMTFNGIPKVGRVEVLGKYDQISVLYFPVPRIVLKCWLRPQVQACKNAILYPDNILKRSNPDEKLKDFMEQSDKLVNIIDHEYMLMEMTKMGGWRSWLIATVGQQNETFSYISLLFSVSINVLVLLKFRYNDKTEEIEGESFVLNTTLPFLHFLAAICVVVSYTIITGWRTVANGFKRNPTNTFKVCPFLYSHF